MLICRHIASFNWDVHAAAVRALLTVGVDLLPVTRIWSISRISLSIVPVVRSARIRTRAQSTQLTEIVEFLKEKFRMTSS